MLFQIFSFVLEVVFGLLAGGCLLRLYMQRSRVPFGNPVGRFVMSLTNWLVLPLRRVLPAMGAWDTASLVGALLLELLHYGLLLAVSGAFASVGAGLIHVLVFAIFGLMRLALGGLLGLLIVYAILSWTRSDSQIGDVIDRLCAPPLRPVRRLMPLIGGMDLSPLVLLVIVQILQMLLAGLQPLVLRAVG
jgi:YggT family protein